MILASNPPARARTGQNFIARPVFFWREITSFPSFVPADGAGAEKLPLLDCIEISSELRSHGQAGSDGVVPGSHDVMTNKYLVTLTGYYDGWKLPDNEFMCED